MLKCISGFSELMKRKLKKKENRYFRVKTFGEDAAYLRKERSDLFQQMRKAGYQKEEIFYLNLRMLQAAKEDKLETVTR